MAKESYNTWANYETWNAKMCLDNDPDDDRYWQGVTAKIWETAAGNMQSKSEAACDQLAETLRQKFCTDDLPDDCLTEMYADLLDAALSKVDWREIANALVEDRDEAARATAEESL